MSLMVFLPESLALLRSPVCAPGLTWGEWPIISPLAPFKGIGGGNRSLACVLQDSYTPLINTSEAFKHMSSGPFTDQWLCSALLGLFTAKLALESTILSPKQSGLSGVLGRHVGGTNIYGLVIAYILFLPMPRQYGRNMKNQDGLLFFFIAKAAVKPNK